MKHEAATRGEPRPIGSDLRNGVLVTVRGIDEGEIDCGGERGERRGMARTAAVGRAKRGKPESLQVSGGGGEVNRVEIDVVQMAPAPLDRSATAMCAVV